MHGDVATWMQALLSKGIHNRKHHPETSKTNVCMEVE
jgi:hypothetical protein